MLLPRFWSRRTGIFLNVRSALARLKAYESTHELARASVAFARGEAPELGASSFTGGAYDIEVADGAHILRAPGATELCKRLLSAPGSRPLHPPFEWVVPPAGSPAWPSEVAGEPAAHGGDRVGRRHEMSLTIAP